MSDAELLAARDRIMEQERHMADLETVAWRVVDALKDIGVSLEELVQIQAELRDLTKDLTVQRREVEKP